MYTSLDQYFQNLKGKNVAVLGIGISNIPLIRMLLSYEIAVTACDRTAREELNEEVLQLERDGARLCLGSTYLDHLDADIIFRTPGMHPNVPAICRLRDRGAVITSEMEAFFEVCPCPIIAITGSDGKTTTTSIVAELLKHAGKKVWVGGNIGSPLLPHTQKMSPCDYAVIELSSFQLMNMKKSPHVAVITNLTPNHLDIHRDMAEYVEAKENIYRYQSENDKLVLNYDNNITASFLRKSKAPVTFFSRNEFLSDGLCLKGETIFRNGEALLERKEILIPGMHNVENYMAAIAATEDYISENDIHAVARSFAGVEHRIELVRNISGVRYYNDSIASSPSRTIAGLYAFDQKVILIAGGYDKHLSFNSLADVICARVKHLVLCGATAEKIKEAVMQSVHFKTAHLNLSMANNLEEAVKIAQKSAVSGDVIILSPACASFDQFKNFDARGKEYKRLVAGLVRGDERI